MNSVYFSGSCNVQVRQQSMQNARFLLPSHGSFNTACCHYKGRLHTSAAQGEKICMEMSGLQTSAQSITDAAGVFEFYLYSYLI
jgi:hypothetical protein